MAEEKKTTLKEANELARTIFNSMPYEQRKRLGAPDDRLREINALIEKGDYLSMAHLKKRKKELEDWLIDWYKEICKKSLQAPETCKENGNSFTSLEEAAEKYATEWHKNPDGSEWRPLFEVSAIKAFIAGAEWQKAKMPMPEDTVIFQKGIEEGKRLLMEEAVEGKIEEVSFDNGELHNTIFFSFNEESLHVENRIWFPRCGKDGDKVKIIIVKEDGK